MAKSKDLRATSVIKKLNTTAPTFYKYATRLGIDTMNLTYRDVADLENAIKNKNSVAPQPQVADKIKKKYKKIGMAFNADLPESELIVELKKELANRYASNSKIINNLIDILNTQYELYDTYASVNKNDTEVDNPNAKLYISVCKNQDNLAKIMADVFKLEIELDEEAPKITF